MSRIGKKPIEITKGVEVTVTGHKVSVKGPKGSVERNVHPTVSVAVEGGHIKVTPATNLKENSRYHGLTRTLIANMVTGVTQGFSKSLTLVGVGYRAAQNGKAVTLSVGYSHPVEFVPPAGIEIKVDKQTTLLISGAEKEVVGQVAATIRDVRPPEPYNRYYRPAV